MANRMSNLPTRPKIKGVPKVNVQKSVAAGRRAGLIESDVRKLLAGGAFGKTIPDGEIRDITKGIKFKRWSLLMEAIRKCDAKLSAKGCDPDIWVAINKAKAEYLTALATLTQELDSDSKATPSYLNGQGAPHAFGPREQIGNVTSVQVNIAKAPEHAPPIDVPTLPNPSNGT